ncbi:Hypothetical protein CHV_a0364 [Cardinium endosymbiont cBtQ1 of Bemisia tabaci]|nr:Hypothetical protein CHV_a0364 [Cardinium endosymbiont cBtQ1 of Bemisia tabaci]
MYYGVCHQHVSIISLVLCLAYSIFLWLCIKKQYIKNSLSSISISLYTIGSCIYWNGFKQLSRYKIVIRSFIHIGVLTWIIHLDFCFCFFIYPKPYYIAARFISAKKQLKLFFG